MIFAVNDVDDNPESKSSKKDHFLISIGYIKNLRQSRPTQEC